MLNFILEQKNEEFFPNNGELVTINIENIDYARDLTKIQYLIEQFKNETAIVASVESWLQEFAVFLSDSKDVQGINMTRSM